ncbi:MAG: response regulator [Acidobacteriota bacterium]
MAGSSLASTAPARQRVLVVEDEEASRRRLESLLFSVGAKQVKFATTTKECIDLTRADEFDVASLDWELNGFFCGKILLDEIADSQRHLATVVWTKHHNVLAAAKGWGADWSLPKTPDADEYVDAIQRALRLTHSRRVLEALHPMLGGPACPLTAARFTPEVEADLCERARTLVLERVQAGEPLGALKQRLVDRGWWSLFDPTFFVALDRCSKVSYLWSFLHEDIVTLQAILGEDAANQVAGARSQAGGSATAPIPESVDLLLSVLSHLLTIADYNEQLMPYYWNVEGLFADSSSRPPWEGRGMRQFMLVGDLNALRASVRWMRSH